MDTGRIAQSPAPITPIGERDHERLLDAAREALRLLDDMDQHMPDGLTFGNEPTVRRQLRDALRFADGPLCPDPQDFESSEEYEAACVRHERELTHGPMCDAEREAFELGFVQARAEFRRWRGVG